MDHLDFLKKIAPQAKVEILSEFANYLPEAYISYQINTPTRIAHFWAQGYVESMGLTHFEESLYYSSPERLKAIFGKYIKDEELLFFIKQSEKTGNRVYCNRNGNGVEDAGDGFKYRGRGIFQLTGKANYKKMTDNLDVDLVTNPDLVKLPHYALMTALEFWKTNNINRFADGIDDQSVTNITKVINGGKNALAERIAAFKKIKPICDIYFKK